MLLYLNNLYFKDRLYVTVVHDLNADDWSYEFSMFARPGTEFMDIDYSEINSFGVGLNAEVLKFDTSVINELLGLERPAKSWVTVYNAETEPNGRIWIPPPPQSHVDFASILGRTVPPTPHSVRVTITFSLGVMFSTTTATLDSSGILYFFANSKVDYTFVGGVLKLINSTDLIVHVTKIEFLQ